jgi:hypothetical protein
MNASTRNAKEALGYRIAPIWTWMEESGEMKKIARRAVIYENPEGRLDVSDIIEFQRNMSRHVQYELRMNYEAWRGITTLDKEVEHIKADKSSASPKFLTLRHIINDLVNPTTNQSLVEGIVPMANRQGKMQVMFFENGDNSTYVRRIKKDPAAWFWNYMQSIGLDMVCIKSLMDSFALESRMFSHRSTFDPETWVVTKEEGHGCADFVADMDDLLGALSDHSSDEEKMGDGGIEFTADAKKDMLTTMRMKDDLQFGAEMDAKSRADGYEGSSGASSLRGSATSARYAAQKMVSKGLADEVEKERKKNEELLARISRLESLTVNQHGNPPVSGSSPAGETPPHQNADVGGSAGEQV